MDSLGAMIDSAVCQGREVDPLLPVWHICYIARNALAVLVITSLDLFNCNFSRYYFSKKKKKKKKEHPGDGWPRPPWSSRPWIRVERSNVFFRYGIAMSLQCWSNQPWFLTATFSGITSLQKSITSHTSPTSTWWTAWASWSTLLCVRVEMSTRFFRCGWVRHPLRSAVARPTCPTDSLLDFCELHMPRITGK